jgi:hypothetical protein
MSDSTTKQKPTLHGRWHGGSISAAVGPGPDMAVEDAWDWRQMVSPGTCDICKPWKKKRRSARHGAGAVP